MTAFPIVLSGASGVGKTALGSLLFSACPELVESVSCTTRSPRGNEQDGVDYLFLDREHFQKMIRDGNFIEWAEVHGEFYGTQLGWMKDRLDQGTSVFSILDVQGGLQMREAITDTCLVFLVPPNMKELESRLRGRNTDSEDSIQSRLTTAITEHEVGLKEYDYIVENNRLISAVSQVKDCIEAHACKISSIREEGIPDE